MKTKSLMSQPRAAWGSLAVGLILALAIRAVSIVITPIQSYLIAVHEVFHALGGWLTGARIESIEAGFTQGATWTAGGWFPVISIAGYAGCALLGAFLIRYCARPMARWALMSFCVVAGLALLVKGDWSLGLICALAINAVLFAALARYKQPALLAFMGCLFTAGAWDDMAVYLFHMTRHTDAGILARHLGAEWLAFPIAAGFAALSLAAWAWAAHGLIKRP